MPQVSKWGSHAGLHPRPPHRWFNPRKGPGGSKRCWAPSACRAAKRTQETRRQPSWPIHTCLHCLYPSTLHPSTPTPVHMVVHTHLPIYRCRTHLHLCAPAHTVHICSHSPYDQPCLSMPVPLRRMPGVCAPAVASLTAGSPQAGTAFSLVLLIKEPIMHFCANLGLQAPACNWSSRAVLGFLHWEVSVAGGFCSHEGGKCIRSTDLRSAGLRHWVCLILG